MVVKRPVVDLIKLLQYRSQVLDVHEESKVLPLAALACYSFVSNCFVLASPVVFALAPVCCTCVWSYGCLLLSNNSCLCNWWGRLGYYRSYDWGPTFIVA